MKRRLSASIDEHLMAAAEASVRDGRAPSLSALVEQAIGRQLELERRKQAMVEFMDAFEEEFGVITPEERKRYHDELMASARPPAHYRTASRRGRDAA